MRPAPHVDVKTLPNDRARRMMPIVEKHGWGRADKNALRRDLHRLELAERCAEAFAGVWRGIWKQNAKQQVSGELRAVPMGEALARRGMA